MSSNQKKHKPPECWKPVKPQVEVKFIEFRIYTFSSGYMGDLELLATVVQEYKDVHNSHGHVLCLAKNNAEEYVRNIGLYGITVEDPAERYNYYPPNRIAKVEYNEV
jgi:hypothetical protein